MMMYNIVFLKVDSSMSQIHLSEKKISYRIPNDFFEILKNIVFYIV